MKKTLLAAGIALSAFIFFSCDNVNNQQNNSSEEDSSVSNNLSESNGTNELSGNTFSNSSVQYSFDENSVTQSNASLESSSSLRAAISYESAQVFNYSFNSESDPKTLEFQLESVWGTGVAQDYEAQLKNAKSQVSAAQTSILAAIDSLDLSTISASVSASSSLSAETFSSAIKSALKTKLESFLSSQNSILSDYLASKYNAVIKFNYTIEDNSSYKTLTLSEQFKGDLSDASSKFVSSDSTVVLNDYDNLIPFKIVSGETVYVGTPEITKTDENSGTLEVSLFPYYGDVVENESEYAETVNSQISAIISSFTSDSDYTTIVKIATEIAASSDSTSSTLNSLIDEYFGSFILSASYEITEASDENTKTGLTLTYTSANSSLNIEKDDTVSLTYTPLIETSEGFSTVVD